LVPVKKRNLVPGPGPLCPSLRQISSIEMFRLEIDLDRYDHRPKTIKFVSIQNIRKLITTEKGTADFTHHQPTMFSSGSSYCRSIVSNSVPSNLLQNGRKNISRHYLCTKNDLLDTFGFLGNTSPDTPNIPYKIIGIPTKTVDIRSVVLGSCGHVQTQARAFKFYFSRVRARRFFSRTQVHLYS
jgi:hypothetical protein